MKPLLATGGGDCFAYVFALMRNNRRGSCVVKSNMSLSDDAFMTFFVIGPHY